MLTLIVAAAVIAVPAAILRVACFGAACGDDERAQASDVPFCSLPPSLRRDVAAGYREGRSPEVLAAAREEVIAPGDAGLWPGEAVATDVPLYFAGAGVGAGPVPSGTTLDAVAPTIAEIIGLERPHPEVRSGRVIEGVATGETPRLVVLIVAKGVGSEGFEPGMLGPAFASGTGTVAATTGSQPLDPAAVLATIGTGGLPRQHGITGELIRNDEGRLVTAWGRDAPVSVIASLADDLDESTEQRAKVGAALGAPSDRGVVGGNWYVGGDKDDITIARRAAKPDLSALVRGGYGRDDVTDLFAVVLEGDPPDISATVRDVAGTADRLAGGSYALVFTATGARPSSGEGPRAGSIARRVETELGADVVEGVAAGGLFLDADVQTEEKISEDNVMTAMRDLRSADGDTLFADVFPALAVSFARYC